MKVGALTAKSHERQVTVPNHLQTTLAARAAEFQDELRHIRRARDVEGTLTWDQALERIGDARRAYDADRHEITASATGAYEGEGYGP
jgi:hypothetical protein